METIYRVTVHGRKLESRDLRKLLARAVAEKRSMDQRLRLSRPLMAHRWNECATACLETPARVAV